MDRAPIRTASCLPSRMRFRSAICRAPRASSIGHFERNPNDSAVLNLRGVLHAQREELPEARRDFAEAVKLAPTLTPAWQNLARACQLQSEKDVSAMPCAVESWQRVLRLKPQDEEALGSLSLLYEKSGKFAESLRQVEHLPQQHQLSTLILRCADLTALGRVNEATKAAQELSQSNEFSEADFASVQNAFESAKAAPVVVILVTALDSRRAAGVISLRRLAIAYEQLERPAEARKVLERVAVLDPKNTSHLLELARLADAAGDHEAALGYLAHAQDIAPDNAQIHFLFAMVANEMELPVQARASLDRALALEPNSPVYNFAMGVVILSSRDGATAESYFKKFVATKPDNSKGHYALGVAYFASGDYAKSKAEMEKVIGKKEIAGGPEYFLGCMARREDDLPAAARFLRESIKLMPGFAESHTELARIFMTQGDLTQARSELDTAVRIDPKSFGANSQLLAVYRRTHDSRAEAQADLVKKLDENRSKRAELMLRMIDARPIEQAARQSEKPVSQ